MIFVFFEMRMNESFYYLHVPSTFNDVRMSARLLPSSDRAAVFEAPSAQSNARESNANFPLSVMSHGRPIFSPESNADSKLLVMQANTL